jgi:hypothetical protein
MAQIAIVSAQLNGDIGGIGVSKFHVASQNAAALTPADVTAVGAAVRSLLFTAATWIPADIVWSFPTQVPVIESTSAIIQAELLMTTAPLNVTGTAAGTYAGGNGARVNWKTTTLGKRRFMRAATYLVPLAGAAFTASGGISATFLTNMSGACATFLTALNSAGLELVSYHRPAKGASSGGTYGAVTVAQIPSQPATLRSRRQ